MTTKSYSKKSGFTMVELAVTMSIFAVLTGVVLANYRTFSNNADFLNVADSIALSLREAQIYGVGSKGASPGCGTPSSAFNCAYGVVFNAGDNFYKIFVDTNEDSIYTSADYILETVNLPSGSRIADVGCDPLGTCSGLAVLFKRPSPDAIIRNILATDTVNYSSASITVVSATKSSLVEISRTGQISVTTTNNTP